MNVKTMDWKTLFEKTGINKPIYYTLSGSHLYGFNSPDSDIDIRGCHSESLNNVLGLHREKEVRERTDGDLDFVSFDIRKEITLLLANNSNVLEHLVAPPLFQSGYYPKLKALAHKSLSKLVAKPYWGMAEFNYKKFLKNELNASPIKKYLYVMRALEAGAFALTYQKIEPNAEVLNKHYGIDIMDTLIERKRSTKEKQEITKNERVEADKAINNLKEIFKDAEKMSSLPITPNTYKSANELLIRIRKYGDER